MVVVAVVVVVMAVVVVAVVVVVVVVVAGVVLVVVVGDGGGGSSGGGCGGGGGGSSNTTTTSGSSSRSSTYLFRICWKRFETGRWIHFELIVKATNRKEIYTHEFTRSDRKVTALIRVMMERADRGKNYSMDAHPRYTRTRNSQVGISRRSLLGTPLHRWHHSCMGHWRTVGLKCSMCPVLPFFRRELCTYQLYSLVECEEKHWQEGPPTHGKDKYAVNVYCQYLALLC